MKVLGIFGLIVSVIALTFGLHLHFAYARAVVLINKEIDSAIAERGLDFLQSPEYRDMYQMVDFETTYGMAVLLLGTLSVLMSIFPAVKKFNIAWIGVIFGLITFALGAMHGTHLFD